MPESPNNSELKPWYTKTIYKVSTIIVFLAALFGFLADGSSTYDRIFSKDHPTPTVIVEDQGTYVSGNQNTTYNLSDEYTSEIRKFQKFVPKSYLSSLPRIKSNAYFDASLLWDTGVTSEMLKGSQIVHERTFDILVDLANVAYTKEFFDGKSTEEFYADKINSLSKASYESLPPGMKGGSIASVAASGNFMKLADEFVMNIVKNVTDSIYYLGWEKDWIDASDPLVYEKSFDDIEQYLLSGYIYKYPVQMDLLRYTNNYFEGYYMYEKVKERIDVKGSIEDGYLILTTFNPRTGHVESFKGVWNEGSANYNGIWNAPDIGKSYNFQLNKSTE